MKCITIQQSMALRHKAVTHVQVSVPGERAYPTSKKVFAFRPHSFACTFLRKSACTQQPHSVHSFEHIQVEGQQSAEHISLSQQSLLNMAEAPHFFSVVAVAKDSVIERRVVIQGPLVSLRFLTLCRNPCRRPIHL